LPGTRSEPCQTKFKAGPEQSLSPSVRRGCLTICACRQATGSKPCTVIGAGNTASASTINGGYASNGAKLRHGTSRSWTSTEDDAMSIKHEDLHAGRIDFSDVSGGKRLPLIHPGETARRLMHMAVAPRGRQSRTARGSDAPRNPGSGVRIFGRANSHFKSITRASVTSSVPHHGYCQTIWQSLKMPALAEARRRWN
jgi:hypothetical protein